MEFRKGKDNVPGGKKRRTRNVGMLPGRRVPAKAPVLITRVQNLKKKNKDTNHTELWACPTPV